MRQWFMPGRGSAEASSEAIGVACLRSVAPWCALNRNPGRFDAELARSLDACARSFLFYSEGAKTGAPLLKDGETCVSWRRDIARPRTARTLRHSGPSSPPV